MKFGADNIPDESRVEDCSDFYNDDEDNNVSQGDLNTGTEAAQHDNMMVTERQKTLLTENSPNENDFQNWNEFDEV